MPQLSPILCGVAGEYFVAAERSRRGYIATLTLRNTRDVDILAADETRSVRIQVKTNQGSKRDWMVNREVETLAGDQRLFFVFVHLNGLDQPPSFHVVPLKHVIKSCRDQTEGLKARDMDNAIRHFMINDDLYLNRWDFLGLKSAVPRA